MRSTKVLLIESARKNGVTFAASLKRKYEVLVATTGKQGLELAQTEKPDVLVLNAESMRTPGDRISARLRAQLGDLPIIHIRPEGAAAADNPADVILSPPFTSRKLINRVQRYIKTPEAEVLSIGPFNLNLEQGTLTTPWGEKKLTPKLAELMELFLRNQDNTLERKHIMQTIWKTDYMGDTRTLDVHIRWLRKVVEPEPRKPKYITTVRGVGYCFTLPEGSTSETTGKPKDISPDKQESAAKAEADKPDAVKPSPDEKPENKNGDS